ncbi:type III-B CRISPR module RAMP protein Cmr4 [Paenibacillus polymyxa]|uniref:type III-B CRISPR module RAMP protein Cmr4 n=1 Tax=Paenibacillus polymyxa TaxID=1406 RepID=UPI0018692842|nr:type III-B CRISPR module RAMP protein Cmr4 [Paenibacillus polymyxa]MBE3650746.1 type III-B CRISPR module RAMP protein Cmr4 [Paenibacillus polymyxa]
MENVSQWYWIHCLSPLHIGSGEGLGAIDLPIMREKVTEWPMIPGSSMKGVKRDYYRAEEGESAWFKQAFGKSDHNGAEAGALVISDGRILAFPVASRYGTFAYVTSPMVLKRLVRDAAAMGMSLEIPNLDQFEQDAKNNETAWITSDSVVVSQQQVFLDEFYGEAEISHGFTTWANWLANMLFDENEPYSKKMFIERLVLVSDDTFRYFTTMCCEITPRIRIQENTKTTQAGALWYEEYVPTEAIFYGMIWCDRIDGSSDISKRISSLQHMKKEIFLQLGGNASVGKGRVRCRLSGGGDQ